MEGPTDGDADKAAAVGSFVAVKVGLTLGETDGIELEDFEGDTEGRDDGVLLGSFVGDAFGRVVGYSGPGGAFELVGDALGLMDGADVGFLVGASVTTTKVEFTPFSTTPSNVSPTDFWMPSFRLPSFTIASNAPFVLLNSSSAHSTLQSFFLTNVYILISVEGFEV